MIVRIELPDEALTLDISRITASEWKVIRAYTGHNPGEFFAALAQVEIEAVEALFWVVQRKNNRPQFNIGEKDFDLIGFMEAWRTGEAAAAEQLEADAPKA